MRNNIANSAIQALDSNFFKPFDRAHAIVPAESSRRKANTEPKHMGQLQKTTHQRYFVAVQAKRGQTH